MTCLFFFILRKNQTFINTEANSERASTARPFEILQAQEMYIQSQLDYLRALTEHSQAQYRMYVALGNKL